MDHLQGRLQHYDWGSTTALAELRGLEPTGSPEAELWFGAHPSSPATLDRGGRTDGLDAVLAADPSAELGPAAGMREGTLPFLVKLLAADVPLSIQAHPDRPAAEAGYAAENESGIPLGSANRSFRDARRKPELVVAVTPFRALCGFRQIGEALGVAAALGLPDELLAPLREQGPVAWSDVVGRILTGDPSETVEAMMAHCDRGVAGAWAATVDLVLELSGRFPGDPALALVPLLVEHHLEPGEALFLGPGVLHAYLGGLAVEVMASSDNVLRGGLTSKHVDVERLVESLDPGAAATCVQRPGPGVHRYDTPVEEFSVWRMEGTTVAVNGRSGPDIVVCIDGSTALTSAGTGAGLELAPGCAAWVPHDDGAYRIDAGGLAYRITTGEPGA
jgi:mannose-6-phosphate isomerase